MSDDPKYRILETGPANSRRFFVQFEFGDGVGGDNWNYAMLAPDFTSLQQAKDWLADKTEVRPPDIIHNYP